jgi:hypothetical protein
LQTYAISNGTFSETIFLALIKITQMNLSTVKIKFSILKLSENIRKMFSKTNILQWGFVTNSNRKTEVICQCPIVILRENTEFYECECKIVSIAKYCTVMCLVLPVPNKYTYLLILLYSKRQVVTSTMHHILYLV